jgi:hypothetical protein
MNKKSLHLVAGFFIIIFSLYYAFKDVSAAEIIRALNSIRFIYVLPAVLMVAVSFSFRALRWRYLIASFKKVKTSNLYSPLMIGLMGNMLPARAGEFIRAYLLSKKEGISYSASFATIFIERLFDLFIVLLLLAWVLFFESAIFLHGDSAGIMKYMIKFGWISFGLCMLILLFSIFLQYRNQQAMELVNYFTKPLPLKWGEKIINAVNSFSGGLMILRNKRGFTAAVLLSILISVVIVLTFYFLYLAFDLDTKLPVLPSLLLLCLVVDIFVALFPTPGFLGSFHAACVAALHGVFNISKAVALSYGIVAWLVFMGFTVVVGAFFALKDNISISTFQTDKEDA